jgi:hypothetical protein
MLAIASPNTRTWVAAAWTSALEAPALKSISAEMDWAFAEDPMIAPAINTAGRVLIARMMFRAI